MLSERMKKKGILVRYFDIPGVRDFVRIAIGKLDNMNRFHTKANDIKFYNISQL